MILSPTSQTTCGNPGIPTTSGTSNIGGSTSTAGTVAAGSTQAACGDGACGNEVGATIKAAEAALDTYAKQQGHHIIAASNVVENANALVIILLTKCLLFQIKYLKQ